MPFELRLFNPSDYPRTGHVTVGWADLQERTHIEPERLVVRSQEGDLLPYQIDPVFSGKAKLSFTLAETLGSVERVDSPYGHPASYVILDCGDARAPERAGPKPEVVEGARDDKGRLMGIKLRNELLEVWIDLIPAPWDEKKDWFSGSVTSVVLTARKEVNKEFLDAFDWEHDPEKRIQLDRILLSCPAWDAKPHQVVSLFNQPYDLIAQSMGPVRATITLASAPFEYSYKNFGKGGEQRLVCKVFRVLSLYAGSHHVIEELFVRASPDGILEGRGAVDLTFEASYFAYMRMRGGLKVSRFEQVPDWFTVTGRRFAASGKFHSYGFATDVPAGPVVHPVPGHIDPENAENAFSWSLAPCKSAKCLHLFSFWRPEDSQWPEGVDFWANEEGVSEVAQRVGESRTGKAWYEFVSDPLLAKL